ncbi:MAG: HAD hydrolase family protein [Candidatus Sumerlaeota bacterium]|nr:HAD hydrolase family protein [Candidatus Sumerlaeota bacterium]
MLTTTELQQRLKEIRMIVLDVDGVMTAGQLILGEADEYKAFSCLDGHGLRMAMRHGLCIAIITGRRSQAVERRAAELGIEDLFQDAKNKMPFFHELLARHGLQASQALYIGDDLPDLPLMRAAGVGVAVANAHEEVLARADYVTRKNGGEGAVREMIDMVLKATGKWDEAMERYLKD